MASLDLSHTGWAKSSYSGGEGGQCVEWAPTVGSGPVRVRDSKAPGALILGFGAGAWASFVGAVKRAGNAAT